MKDATSLAIAQSLSRNLTWNLSAKSLLSDADEFSTLLDALGGDSYASLYEGSLSTGLALTRLALLKADQQATEIAAQQSTPAQQSVAQSSGSSIAGRWPVRGEITSPFGHRDVPGLPSNHTGIDIAVPTGTHVAVTADGVVKFAGWQNGYGNIVEVEHANGIVTMYAHNSQLLVEAGQHVSQGQAIALSGSTGLSTGPHVHYEVRVNGQPVDPAPYMNQQVQQPELAKLDDSQLRDLVQRPASTQEVQAQAAVQEQTGQVEAVAQQQGGQSVPNGAAAEQQLQAQAQPDTVASAQLAPDQLIATAPVLSAGSQVAAVTSQQAAAQSSSGQPAADASSSRSPAAAATADSAQTTAPAATSLDQMVSDTSKRFGLDEGLLRAVIQTESGFNPSAVSRAGAKGLMQLMDGTAKALGVSDSLDPAQNVEGGAKYLRQLIDRFGDVKLALAAYNAGPGRVAQYGGIPPFAETQRFVQRVQQNWQNYQARATMQKGDQA